MLYAGAAIMSTLSATIEWWTGDHSGAIRGLLLAVAFVLLALTAGRPRRVVLAAVVLCLAGALVLAFGSWLS
jgi:hypothetical protein